jgi:hypothetical protein
MSNPDCDPKRVTKLLSYMSTFDGGLYRQSKRKDGDTSKVNAKFIMNMRADNLDYVEWVKETLGCFTEATIKNRGEYNTDGHNRAPQVRLESRRHPQLTRLHERIYINGHKVIDPHMLKLMDAEALAIIFMCDGGSSASMRPGSRTPSPSITLNTKGFSYADNMLLSKTIYEHLGIRTNVNRHSQYWYLRVPTKDAGPFVAQIEPHVLPSFRYKLERLAPCVNHIRLREGGEIVQTCEESYERC